MAAKASWHCHRMYCFTLLVCVARTTPTRPIATRSACSVWAGRELKNIANINKRREKKSKTCDMPRVRRDHPRCRRATWFGVCGHTRDFIARLGFHRNPFRRFGDTRSRNLPIPITLASAWLLAFTVYKPLFFSRSRLKLNSTTRTRHGPDRTRTDPHGLFCGETPLDPCRSGRVRAVEFSYYETEQTWHLQAKGYVVQTFSFGKKTHTQHTHKSLYTDNNSSLTIS